MEYILLDNLNGDLNIITKDDESGEPLIFDDYEKAKAAMSEECQNGIVVPLTNGKLFTQKEVVKLLVSFDQAVNPEEYNSSEGLDSTDFFDAAYGNAKELGLLSEFENLSEKHKNSTDGVYDDEE